MFLTLDIQIHNFEVAIDKAQNVLESLTDADYLECLFDSDIEDYKRDHRELVTIYSRYLLKLQKRYLELLTKQKKLQ